MFQKLSRVAPLTLAAMILPGLLAAQGSSRLPVSIEARGGVNVPTFDIADVADPGPSFGVGIEIPVAGRLSILADADFGFHSGADLPVGGSGPDVDVYHFMAKAAYELIADEQSRWSLRINAGAGAMTFKIDGVSGSFTYPAINVGAKLGYDVSENINLFLSPQGDIAFSDENEIGTDNAWIWPFALGAAVRF
ncbi:MAG: outer membrane beta-barrel protein [Gemmatimonadales bacterium]|nr:outer membrane beta-barrel protein [Gemmatimonadales bacterium]